MTAMKIDLSVVILTCNEEANIAQALESVHSWARRIFIVDSFSTDRTLEIAQGYGCAFHQFPFESYSRQRNRALTDLPIDTEWVLFLDADEWVPEKLKLEIAATLERGPVEDGFFLRRRFYWMNTWIRRGYYPVWILRLFRYGAGICEDRSVNEHIVVPGQTGFLKNDFIHEDRKPVSDWIDKHNRYAIREAKELLKTGTAPERISARFFGPQAERARWLRERLYNRLPPILRPCLFFFYRVVIRGGILDGRNALLYHFLQAFWYPLLIDIEYLELTRGRQPCSPELQSSQAQLELSHEHPVPRR
jgi:glycosyltransferase involved in cell wall biosynthesis